MPKIPLFLVVSLALGQAHATALRTFAPSAFVIKRQVGQLGFATETEWQYYGGRPNPLDPNTPKRTIEASGISVRLFEAQLDDGTRVLLKEYIGDEAKELAENEAATHELLAERAGGALAAAAPVGRLIGRMRGDSSFASAAFILEWERALPTVLPPSSSGLWLCFAWEPLRTMSGFPRVEQERSWLDLDGSGAARARRAFVKRAFARTVRAVGWLHGQGVVHRSLGGSSLLLSTYDQREAPAVKIIDLGFAATAVRLSEEDVASALARGAQGPLDVFPFLCRADDLHALAYVLLELCLTSFHDADGAAAPPDASASRPTDVQSLKRLVEDVFGGDVAGAFRDYCLEDPEWAGAAALLDEPGRAGWRLAQELVDCRSPESDAAKGVSAAALLDSPWFDAGT